MTDRERQVEAVERIIGERRNPYPPETWIHNAWESVQRENARVKTDDLNFAVVGEDGVRAIALFQHPDAAERFIATCARTDLKWVEV